jgi:hypothetical protein
LSRRRRSNRLAFCSIQSRDIIPRAWETAQEFWDITWSITFGGIGASGFFPVLAGRDPINEDGKATVSSFLDFAISTRPQSKRSSPWLWFRMRFATSMFPGMARRAISGFGSEYKKQVRRFYTSPVGMTVRAAMLSRFENYAEIDPNGVVDAWGIPVLKMHIEYSDNEREMAKDAAETSEEILRAAAPK